MFAITKNFQRSAVVGGSSFAMKWDLSQVPAVQPASITHLTSSDISFSFIISLISLQSQGPSPAAASFQFIPTSLINSQSPSPRAPILLLYKWSLLISQGTVILLTQPVPLHLLPFFMVSVSVTQTTSFTLLDSFGTLCI